MAAQTDKQTRENAVAVDGLLLFAAFKQARRVDFKSGLTEG